MKKNAFVSLVKACLSAPAYPFTGPQVFMRLRAALTQALGFEPSYPRLGSIIGEESSLTHYWFNVLPQRHVIAFLALLERLPEPKRRELLSTLCRELTSLENPRLAHDALAVSNLEQILSRRTGITWIEGGSEFHRTFLLTALGHSLATIAGADASISGLDVHEPRKWVPVENVVYLKEAIPAPVRRALINQAWPGICGSDAALFLFNGVWSEAPELRAGILGLAREHHVIVTVAAQPTSNELESVPDAPVHVVSVSPAREHESWIRIRTESR